MHFEWMRWGSSCGPGSLGTSVEPQPTTNCFSPFGPRLYQVLPLTGAGMAGRQAGVYGHSPPCMSRPPLSHAQEEQMLHHLAGGCWRGDWARTGRGWGFSPPPNQAIKQCFLLTVCGHHLSCPSATGSLGSLCVSLPRWALSFSSLHHVHTCRGGWTVWGTCDPGGNHAEKCSH